eukprot:gene19137-22919_t
MQQPQQPAQPAPTTSSRKSSLWDRPPDPNEQVIPVGQHQQSMPPGSNPMLNQQVQSQKQSRRLYVGNIPQNISEVNLTDFFNAAFLAANLAIKPGNPVVLCQINQSKSFAFVEFRSTEEATAAMGLDGISLHSFSLKIRRPKDYVTPSENSGGPMTGPGGLSIVSTNVPDSENKIFIGGLPTNLNEEQVKAMLSSVGKLKAFNLVKDIKTGQSKGFAFCEYFDPEVTDRACNELHGTKFGDKSLLVQRASLGHKDGIPFGIKGIRPDVVVDSYVSSLLNLNSSIPHVLGSTRSNITSDNNTKPSKVIQLLNLAHKDDIKDEQIYEHLLIDVKEECEEFGEVESIFISRPRQDNPLDIIKVFVRFVAVESAQKAWMGLGGRRYNHRTVITAFYPEDLFIIEGNQEEQTNAYDMEM